MKMIRVFRSGIHLGEERIVEGNRASGMVTLSGCHLACNFCYTPETSIHKLGKDFSSDEFYQLCEELVARGARNINLISPTHVWSELSRPLADLRQVHGRLLPIVLKVSGFESRSIAKSRRRGAHRKAERLSEWLETLLHLYSARVLPIDLATARRAGALADRARGQGQAPGLADLTLAATAQQHGCIILTRNIGHFDPLGVPVLDPFKALPADVV